MPAVIEAEDLTRSFPSGVALDGLTFGRPRRGAGPARPQRRRQDHHGPPAQRRPPPRSRLGPPCSASTRRPTATRCAAAPACSPRTPASTTGSPPARTSSSPPGSAASTAAGRRGGRPTCSSGSAWPTGPTTRSRAPPPASASASPWPGPCCTTPRCCSSTSPPPGSTRPPPATSSTSSPHWPREHGRTVVLCTHFLGEAGRLADRMAVLHRGVLHAFGRPDDLAADLWDGLDATRRPRWSPRGRRGAGGPRPSAAWPGWRRCRTAAMVRVADREVAPGGGRGPSSRPGSPSTAPSPATPLEDVYFEIEARIAATEGRESRRAWPT